MPRFENLPVASWIAMVLLCLVWACEALGPDLLPGMGLAPTSSLLVESTPYAILAIFSAAVTFGLWRPRSAKRLVRRQVSRAVLIGVGLFVLPELLVRIARQGTSAYARTVVLTLVPVFAAVLEPYLGDGELQPIPGALGAALVSTIGSLLVFPVDTPATLFSCFAFGLLVLAAASIAAGSCLAYCALTVQEQSDDLQIHGSTHASAMAIEWPTLSILLATGAAGLWLLDRILAASRQIQVSLGADKALPESWKWRGVAIGTVLEMLAIVLLLWLISRMRPSRAATRYSFAPVITILLGVALLRVGGAFQTSLEPRTWLGIGLMAGGACYLLFRREAIAPAALGLGR